MNSSSSMPSIENSRYQEDIGIEHVISKKKEFCLLPIEHKDLWCIYNDALKSTWHPQDIDLKKDQVIFDNLSILEKNIISTFLAFNMETVMTANEHLLRRIDNQITNLEIRCFFDHTIGISNLHLQTFEHIFDLLTSRTFTRGLIKANVRGYPFTKEKLAWISSWSESSFTKQLIAIEIFASMFPVLFYIIMRMVITSNEFVGLKKNMELISKDMKKISEYVQKMFSRHADKPAEEYVQNIVKEAVAIEINVMNSVMPDTFGVHRAEITGFVQFVGNEILDHLGYNKCWKDAADSVLRDFASDVEANRASEKKDARISRRQKRFNSKQLEDLEGEFTRFDGFIPIQEREGLAEEIGSTLELISSWQGNRRFHGGYTPRRAHKAKRKT